MSDVASLIKPHWAQIKTHTENDGMEASDDDHPQEVDLANLTITPWEKKVKSEHKREGLTYPAQARAA